MAYGLQRANFLKRISAWLFDIILLAILSVLCAWALSGLIGFNGQYQRLMERYDVIAAQHDLDREALSSASYNELTEEMRAQVEAANAALAADSEAVYAYNMVMQMSILIVSIGILLSHLGLEFFVPLMLGEGRTLGKKIFGVAIMRADGVRIGHVTLFARAILGKYAVETMLPVMTIMMFFYNAVSPVALLVVVALGVLQLAFACTRNHTLLHDRLADTVAVDFASQRIFATREDMLAFKQAQHAEQVARQDS